MAPTEKGATELVIKEVLKTAKVLKDSQKFKIVFFKQGLDRTTNYSTKAPNLNKKHRKCKVRCRKYSRNGMVVKVYFDKNLRL